MDAPPGNTSGTLIVAGFNMQEAAGSGGAGAGGGAGSYSRYRRGTSCFVPVGPLQRTLTVNKLLLPGW